MTKFTPEVWLLAARIAYPNIDWFWWPAAKLPVYNPDDHTLFTFSLEDGNDYRALREALEKDYGVIISWVDGKWHSSCFHPDIHPMFDENIVNLMVQNVKALIEAGVVE